MVDPKHFDYSIPNLQDLIKNRSPDALQTVNVRNNTLNQDVPFNRFDLEYSFDGKSAWIHNIEKDLILGEKHPGAGISAYKILGEELAKNGIQLQTSDELYSDGDRLWRSLRKQGLAEVDRVFGSATSGRSLYIPEAERQTRSIGNAEKELNSLFEHKTPISFTDIPWEKKVFQGDPSKAGTMSTVTGNSKVISFSQRPMVIIDIGGFKQPFYRSSGHGGKKDVAAGKWYPFFGIGEHDGWLNKLSGAQINTGYGSEHLQKISEVLNTHFPEGMDFSKHSVGANGAHIKALNESLKGSNNSTATTLDTVNSNINISKTTLQNKLGKVSTPNNTKTNSEEILHNLNTKGGTQPTATESIAEREKKDLAERVEAAKDVEDHKARTKAAMDAQANTSTPKPSASVSNPTPKATNPVPPISPKTGAPIPPATPKPASTKASGSTNPFEKLFSFDTETTGVNPKKAGIWQVGLASRDGKTAIEEHLNPFKSMPINSDLFFDRLKNSNGRFSEDAAATGNFKTAVEAFKSNKIIGLDDALDKTFGTLDSKSILVLQNMEFENKFIKQGREDGLISDKTFGMLQGKMENLAANQETGSVITDLFQKPMSVQKDMREAEYSFYEGFMKTGHQETFEKYVGSLNSAMSGYKAAVSDPLRKGIVNVELMDVSKAFYGNAALKGLIDKRTAMLGTRIDFLSRAFGMGAEAHTALDDSQRTIKLFDKMMPIIDELQSGKPLSQSTIDVFDKIKGMQGDEINHRFMSSVRSVMSDFSADNSTNMKNIGNWYQPPVTVHNKTTNTIEHLDQVSIGKGSQGTSNFESAMDTVLNRYSTFRDEINGFSRQDLIEKVKESRLNGTSYDDITKQHLYPQMPVVEQPTMDLFNIAADTAKGEDKSFFKQSTTLLGKEMTKGTKYGIIGGLLGLGYMASRSPPADLPSQQNARQPVYEQFYDPQYLGTAFVDFNNRNKHYQY